MKGYIHVTSVTVVALVKVFRMKEPEYSFDDVYLSLNDGERFKGTVDPEEMMKNSVITTGFQTRHKLPFVMYNTNKYKKPPKKIKHKLTEETRKDLEIIKMRSALDSKRFYKRNLNKEKMENVQIGTVVDSPLDFYNSRLPSKSRKNTLVDELLADAKFKKDIKKRYVQIIEKKKFKYKKEYKQQQKFKKLKDRK